MRHDDTGLKRILGTLKRVFSQVEGPKGTTGTEPHSLLMDGISIDRKDFQADPYTIKPQSDFERASAQCKRRKTSENPTQLRLEATGEGLDDLHNVSSDSKGGKGS